MGDLRFLKKITLAAILLIILTGAILIFGYMYRHEGVRSINLKVIGESFIGLQYVKEAILTYEDGVYHLKYSCSSREGYEELCKYRGFEGVVREDQANKFLEMVKSLKDEGEQAKCCDHPWTEIEITYMDGRIEKIIVAFEPIKIEEIFDI
ncbi:MAG: hypothetical protein ABDH32_05895 [Candidatus Caldarchaeales archaeon]